MMNKAQTLFKRETGFSPFEYIENIGMIRISGEDRVHVKEDDLDSLCIDADFEDNGYLKVRSAEYIKWLEEKIENS